MRTRQVEYAAEYFTGERCDGLFIIGLLCIIPFSMGEEAGVQSWSWSKDQIILYMTALHFRALYLQFICDSSNR